MARSKKIILKICLAFLTLLFIGIVSVNSINTKKGTISINIDNKVNPETNFFSTPSNEELVPEVEDDSELLEFNHT